MYRANLISVPLLASLVMLASLQLVHIYQPAYSHILSSDENASLLEMFHQIHVQAQLIQTIFPFNTKQAHEHAIYAAAILSTKNWTTVDADRSIVSNVLLPSISTMEELTRTPNSSYSEIKGEVAALDNILSGFTVTYIGDRVFRNSSIQALIISELANDISEKYGKAFGVVVNSSNMMMMMNMSSNSNDNSSMAGMTMMTNTHTKKVSTTNNSNTISDVIDYQTAQALTVDALEILNKDLKPVAPGGATQADAEVQTYLQQLKDAIDNRAPLMDIMTIIHGHIHPLLIATFKLQLKP